MRSLLAALTLTGVAVLTAAPAHAAPGEQVTEAACTAGGGQFSTDRGVRMCTTTTSREVLGPVVTHQRVERYNDTRTGSEEVFTAEARRVHVVETTTLDVQLPGGEVGRGVVERQVSSVVQPLTCTRDVHQGMSPPVREVLPLDRCAEHRLFAAPLEDVPLATAAPAPATRTGNRSLAWCAALGGTPGRASRTQTCTLVTQQQVTGPVVGREAVEVDDDDNPFVGFHRTWVGESQQVQTTETTTVLSQSGKAPVRTEVSSRVVSSAVVPVTCRSVLHRYAYRNAHTLIEHVDPQTCQDKGLFGA
jgi:hypothetical protein